jgi:hypothetical protein
MQREQPDTTHAAGRRPTGWVLAGVAALLLIALAYAVIDLAPWANDSVRERAYLLGLPMSMPAVFGIIWGWWWSRWRRLADRPWLQALAFGVFLGSLLALLLSAVAAVLDISRVGL